MISNPHWFYRFNPIMGDRTMDVTKYKIGDTVYVRIDDWRKRGKITGANLDRDMNFEDWRVSVPNLGHFVSKDDPNVNEKTIERNVAKYRKLMHPKY